MAQELKQGTRLQGGKYIIKRVLGQGGFGITYLAEQVSLGREVAIKEFFMKDSCARNQATETVTQKAGGSNIQVEKYREKFKKEATILASLHHPNIVSIIEVFDENGTSYYVMPYITGGSLRTCRKLSEKRALRYISQVAKALKYMHENNLCHYDVKPSNILLDEYDNAILIDFGISKNYDKDGCETTSTPIGISEGYAPIEQYKGKAPQFSPESDVYSLGATLYFMVMGKIPPTAIELSEGVPLTVNDGVSDSTRNLINASMKLESTKRLQEVDSFINAKPTPSKPIRTPLPAPKPLKIRWNRILEKIRRFSSIVLRVLFWVLLLGSFAIGLLYWINHNKGLTLPYDPIERLEEDMVYVEGGSFFMGATIEQGDEADDDEKPAHKAMVNNFYICKYEVTQGLWKAIMGDNPSGHQGILFDLFKGDLERPVESISWETCQEFIVKLSELSGNHYRLLSEAEWEYAARGGNQNKGVKYSGSNYIYEVAWYGLNSEDVTHTVGTKQPNELGLYDMSGNVSEWCQDAIETSKVSNNYIVRGGNYNSEATDCRVSKRESCDYCYSGLGLRLAADVPFNKRYSSKETYPSWWQKNCPKWLSNLTDWICN